MISVTEAQQLICSYAKQSATKLVSIDDALGFVLAEDIFADRDYPPFNRSAMDGYAVLSSDFFNVRLPIKLKLMDTVMAGEVSVKKVESGTCIKIMTGAPVPEGADAVIRVEDTFTEGGEVVFTVTEVRKKQNIALQGEDAKQGDLVLSQHTLLDAFAIAALAVLGKAEVTVHQSPQVVVISTGNELVNVNAPILPHQIRDSNSHSIKNLLRKYGVNDVITSLVKDDKQLLYDKIKESLNADVIILSGGVSKGDADYVPEVLTSLGIKEVFHRVKIKPGAPLWFGVTPKGGVVFGLPGNPVSVQVAVKVFVEPFLFACFGLPQPKPMLLPMFANKKKKTKLDEFFPCKLVLTDSATGIVPNKMNGSGDIIATLGSDGIALHAADVGDMNEGVVLKFWMW
jgi:molybdopterin molybdotransferase